VTQATPDGCALAFDFGERRIGVAVANVVSGLASELNTLPARNGMPDGAQLDALIDEWRPAVLVVGLPCNMDGSESAMSGRAKKFAAFIHERYALPIVTIDERLTSADAMMELREQRRQGLRRRRLRRADIDSAAARLIAESWLRTKRPA